MTARSTAASYCRANRRFLPPSGLTDAEVAHVMTLLGGRHVRAEGLGHFMHIDDPEWFVRTVLAMIGEFSRVRG